MVAILQLPNRTHQSQPQPRVYHPPSIKLAWANGCLGSIAAVESRLNRANFHLDCLLGRMRRSYSFAFDALIVRHKDAFRQARLLANNKTGFRHSGFRDVANRHRAKHSRHHAKDKQRFLVSVVAYDSLPGHQNYAFTRRTTILSDGIA
ncbi:hypothetical protein ACVJGD_005033 [Bradyrhizobium sp. USDA 10063]